MATEKELQLAQETLETLCKINNTLIEITKDNLNEKNTRNVEKFKITMCRTICITIIVIFLLFYYNIILFSLHLYCNFVRTIFQ